MPDVIYNEDCLIGIKRIPDKMIDLVIIDPPYKINNHNSGSNSNLAIDINKYNKELYDNNLTSSYNYKILDELIRVMNKYLYIL